MSRLATLCRRCHGAAHDSLLILRVEEDGSLTALDRDRRPLGKGRSAEEALQDAGEESPLETIAVRGTPAPRPAPVTLDTLPEELTAAQWRALERRLELGELAVDPVLVRQQGAGQVEQRLDRGCRSCL